VKRETLRVLVIDLPATVARMFNLIDLVIWLLYAAEYLVRHP
jgi:hypothetical protein